VKDHEHNIPNWLSRGTFIAAFVTALAAAKLLSQDRADVVFAP
jgi:hypothetical protein